MPERSATRLRREPQQERSRQQVNRILDAAADIFGAVGYDAATTNAIAERAGTSIGSLYQFFPNKRAIFHALTTRYLSELRSLLDRVLTLEVARLPLPELINRIIDAFWQFARAQRGFAPMVLSAQLSADLVAEENGLIRESVQRIEALLASRAPTLDPARRTLLATVSVDVVNALLTRAVASDVDFGAQVIAEAKALLLAYLRPYDDNAPPTHPD